MFRVREALASLDKSFRLSPTMASRKLLILAFVRDYIEANGASPSFGEIGTAVGTNGARVSAAVRRLVAEGLLRRRAGAHRAIVLPDVEQDALRLLREAGWIVNGDSLSPPVTNASLPLVVELDHISDVENMVGGASNGGSGTEYG